MMKHIRSIVCVIMISMIFCCGCSSNHDSSLDLEADNNSELSSIISEDDELLKESEGTIMMGFQPAEEYEYTYSGTEMEVPLYVGTMDNSEEVEVAAILFLNGEVQPYSYELNGTVSEKQMVHYFTLQPDETINFTAYVTPISGEKGEVLGMQFAAVFKSDYLPSQDGNTSFGNCGRINSTVCIPVNMQAAGVNETKANLVETNVTDIPEEIMAMHEGLVADDTDNPLDYSTYLKIKTEDQKNCLYSENGKLHLTLQMYGGKEVTEKITFFINNEPVKVEDCDYVEISTTSDKMTVFDVSIDVSNYEELCSFYAVAATAGEDYVIQDDTVQSERCLLINGNKEAGDEESSFEDFEYDEVNKKLVLLEVASNDILAQIPVEDTEIIDSYSKISDGYAVIKSTYNENIDNSKNINGIVISQGTSKEKSSYEYMIYDNELQEKEVIDLKSMISAELMTEIEECQSDPRIDPSGQKVAWSTENGIYVLNIKNGEQMVHELEADGFTWYEIAFVDENKLGFYRVTGDTTVDTRYGYWNLATDKLFYEEEKDYSPNQIRVSGKYLVLNDGEDPATHTSSGKVVIYDCDQNQSNVFPVDNTESTFACITKDGENLIVYDCANSELTEHRIRVYQVSSKQCVSENTFTTENSVQFYDFGNTEKSYLLIGNGDSGKVSYHAFTTQ